MAEKDGLQASDPEDHRVARELSDGRRFDIVKVFYDPAELQARLERYGWEGTVSETPEFFISGKLRRAHA